MTSSDAEWSGGYVTAETYTAEFYPQLAPDHLDFACLLNGVQPPDAEARFNYFELGCGWAVSAMALASVHPEARFFANDFMPSHIAAAQALQRQCGLDNLTLLECSFADLAEGRIDLPPLDYITLQGVYSWVNPAVREQIVRFIGRYLKPGGVVYLGYNAMPGWAASSPLQRLIFEVAGQTPGSPVVKATEARAFVQRLAASGADCFHDKPDVTRRLEQITRAGDRYLVHEYLHREWHPMYFIDVARELAAAKLDFVGSSLLVLAMDELPPAQQQVLASVQDAALKETVKDYLLGTGFRCDIFVRGRRALSHERCADRLGRYEVAPALVFDAAMQRLSRFYAGNEAALALVRELVQDILRGPASLNEIARRHRAFDDQALLLSVLAGLSQLGVIQLVDGGKQVPTQSASAFNRAVAAEALLGEGPGVLSSPRARSAIGATTLERCVFALLADPCNPDPRALASALQAAIDASPALRRALASDIGDGSAAALEVQVTAVLNDSLPLWKGLQVIG
jgi:SAM-dependent methyltransferase